MPKLNKILETILVCIISQKGGVGKSFLARLLAREFAIARWATMIADLDIAQGTTVEWKDRREAKGLIPEIAVETFRTMEQVLRIAESYNLIILDTPGHSSSSTITIAEKCAFSFIPTGLSLDDLNPAILLAHEMTDRGINKEKIAFILSRTGDSTIEIGEAKFYITQAGYNVLDATIPEKASYRRAIDSGKVATEATHPSLRKKADELAQCMVDFIINSKEK